MMIERYICPHILIVLLMLVILIDKNRSEIVVLHKLTKDTVFNSSDDIEILTKQSNAAKQKELESDKAKLYSLEPLDACQIPRKPPNLSKLNVYSTKESDSAATPSPSIPETRWVALITGGGDCDLKTKAIHVAQAGYSRVIIKITQPEDVSGYSNLYNDNEIKIDISLLNPAEWDVIQKYVYPKPYVILIPPRPTTTTQIRNEKAWLTSVGGTVLEFVDFVINYPYTVIATIDSLVSRCFKELILSPLRLDKASAKEVVYAFLCFFIPACLILGPFFTMLYVFGERNAHEPRRQRNNAVPPPRAPPPPRFHFDDKFSSNDDNDIDSQQPSLQCDYRKALGFNPNERLTKNKIESAFRQKARNWHPDKHPGKNKAELQKINDQYLLITKAKEKLLNLVHE